MRENDEKSLKDGSGEKTVFKDREAETGVKLNRLWLIITGVCAAAVICIAAFVIVPLVSGPEPVTPAPVTVAPPEPEPAPLPVPAPVPEPEPEILPQFKDLRERNGDLAGWLKIADTVIDYPVMFTPEDGEFYLYRTFEKEDDPSRCGTLFIDKNCSVEPRGTNLLIHGHNMRNGSMFAALLDYRSEDFYDEHKTFEYSTLYETGEYEIVSVFLSKVYNQTDEVFKFYKFYDAANESEFDDFVTNIKELALYDTGVTPDYGDELVTLATCEFSQENGRLVVVGRRAEPS